MIHIISDHYNVIIIKLFLLLFNIVLSNKLTILISLSILETYFNVIDFIEKCSQTRTVGLTPRLA